MDVHDFVNYTSTFNPQDNNVSSMVINIPQNETGTLNPFTFYFKNDRQPNYYTVVSNKYIIFDSFDNTQDVTLQTSKSLVYGWVIPAFTMSDNFIPPLDDQQFPMLLNEAKSLAFLELKQQVHQKSEQEVMRQLTSLQKFKALANRPTPFEQLPSFGRNIGRSGYAVQRSFRQHW